MSLLCPNCGGTNINPIGEWHQCQSKRGDTTIQSCGYIAKIEQFKPTLDDYKE